MEKNLTSGSVLKSILFFSLPYLLSYFLQTLYGMADLFIIGQFEGVASTTAVSIGSQVMHMITVMIVGLAMGATVTIGRAVGAENKLRAARLIGNTVTLFMAGSGRACGPDRTHCLHTGAGRGGHSYLPDHLLYRRSMHHGV